MPRVLIQNSDFVMRQAVSRDMDRILFGKNARDDFIPDNPIQGVSRADDSQRKFHRKLSYQRATARFRFYDFKYFNNKMFQIKCLHLLEIKH